MKRFIGLVFAVLVFGIIQVVAQDHSAIIDQCVAEAGKDATYLKDFVVKLPQATDKKNPPIAKHSLILRKNTMYRFTICTGENSEGEAILKLFDTNRLQATNYMVKSGKIYQSINFNCTKTGPYTVFISFKDGKSGNAIGIMSYVKRN